MGQIFENLKTGAQTYFAKKQVNKLLSKYKDDPVSFFKEIQKRTDNKAFNALLEYIEDNETRIQLFKDIFNSKNGRVVAENLFIHAGLEWLLKNKHKTSNDDFQAPFTWLIDVTNRCNLNCKGCYKGGPNAGDMDKELFERIISEAEEMGTHFFTLLGGEPTLILDKFEDIFRKHSNSTFQMFTNGTTLAGENNKLFEALKRLPNVIPVLSIEGGKEDTDARRGEGVYDKLVEVGEKLKKNNISYGTSHVFTSKNCDSLLNEELFDEWIERGAKFGWMFLYMPVDKNSDINLMPSADQRIRLGNFVRKLRDEKPYWMMDFWNDAPSVNGCIAARRYGHITTEGYVKPCVFALVAQDNIKDKSLKEVWNSELFRKIREDEPHTNNNYQPCMIIGKPHFFREKIVEAMKDKGLVEVEDGSMERIEEIGDELEDYSRKVDEEFRKKGYVSVSRSHCVTGTQRKAENESKAESESKTT